MEKINTQRKSMRIFWARESQNHINNPRIDQIYDAYVLWYSTYKNQENITYSPIGKYLFREYIRKNGYKNAQPKKKYIEKKEKKEKGKEDKVLDPNLEIPDDILSQYIVINNSWVVIIKDVNMFQKHEVKGKRVCLFRGKYREDHYGVIDSLHFINHCQRIIPVLKDKTTNILKYFYPDQLLVSVEKNGNLSIILKDLLVADLRNDNKFVIWIKPNVSLYHEIKRISDIKGVDSVTLLELNII